MHIVSLFEVLAKEIISAEEKFFTDPKDFHSLEASVKASTESFAAAFLGTVLSELNEQIYNSSWRKNRYVVQRQDRRTLISSVGDISFDCTYYRGIGDNSGFTHLVEDVIGLDKNERFTEDAEVCMLCEALKTSYNEAARVLPSKQEITKTTVMNKVHGIADEIPDTIYEERKSVPYLYVEADEDHVAEQHGKTDDKANNKSFISKLVYIYECKRESDAAKGRYELVNKYYFGGLYPGSDGTESLWMRVNRFIEQNYVADDIKRVFISGDGATWIKSGTKYIENAVFCADKYHLMQYLNTASGQFPDEKDQVKENLWHILYSKRPDTRKRFNTYTNELMVSAKNPDKVEQLRSYVLGNWAAVRRTLNNKLLTGCSAEGHVSHVLSDRLSSRPMGWSQTGADRMSKLRCYDRNNSRDKLIDLVKYSRSRRKLEATGTEGIPCSKLRLSEVIAEHYDQARSYIERLQAYIPYGTARKSFQIKESLRLL